MRSKQKWCLLKQLRYFPYIGFLKNNMLYISQLIWVFDVLLMQPHVGYIIDI